MLRNNGQTLVSAVRQEVDEQSSFHLYCNGVAISACHILQVGSVPVSTPISLRELDRHQQP